MKKIILLSTLAFSLSSCYAQKSISLGVRRVNGKKFEVKATEIQIGKGKPGVIVFNADYEYNYKAPPLPKGPHPFPMQMKDIHMENDKVKSIVISVLRYKMQVLKERSETLRLLFSLDQRGAPKNISYSMAQQTSISLKDISEIDEKMKKQVRASFTGTDYLQYNVIHYNMPLISF